MIWKAPRVLFFEGLEERILTLGGVNLEAFFFLDDPDFVNRLGPFGEKVEELSVDPVDRFSDVVEWHGVIDWVRAPVLSPEG